jgi:hypothetical protein
LLLFLLLLLPAAAAATAVVFFGRQKMEESTKWMGAFWLSIAGEQQQQQQQQRISTQCTAVFWHKCGAVLLVFMAAPCRLRPLYAALLDACVQCETQITTIACTWM